ncbi:MULTISPECIES: amidohydrolase family protein [Caballeronia]|jgi:imidazolonepropionase-like amidohydrolase|uniref:Peptidase M38 n=1 Tax=Caballeronia zhejiangensis TaxID=871203 RepID=A0A656QJR2_9BURK|nr:MULTISPECIES: amidohydrolase family protein [Caballeronia]EKS69482.1 putative prolidase [Burkholderia sp. SJ98]KDR29648.1 peptidase M38 [Caballeronia zhejiangensis]MCG7401681.1 amidohydrolase family protein [Caballeronia zhejiangensis]MCI1045251.1 amidohydrolase family protein [Caballeronia zhejiangensis]MDR5767072.1 amidohydrolase family protein [Caballeronia sp. LZ028]
MLILKNARVLDADHERDDGRYSIVIDGDTIREVTREPVEASGAQVIDVGGKTVMPGMIDCHVHVIASVAHLGNNSRLPNTFAVLRAVPILAGMLDRGFTTVRDAGGADYALSRAIEDGVIAGPRLFVAGKALSQTGGHGDFRERFDNADPDPCGCNRNMGAIGRVVDGVDEMRKAVREEMRAGANHIKIMASGGVASPTDPIGNLQFSVDEVKAAVEEAESHQTYVMAHAYTAKAIARVVKLGVRTIEHGNLIDEDAARVMAEHGAYAVPTLVTYDAMSKVGAQMGLAQDTLDKNESVRKRGLEALAMLHERGVKIGLGSDLLGDMHQYQSDELSIRANIVGAFEAIRQATAIGAEIVNMKGKLGVVAAGAYADLLVVDGDPLKDIRVLTGQGERIAGVMKNGAWVREKLL